jgi:hypothetical protein
MRDDDLTPEDYLDAHAVGGELEIGGGVPAQRKQRRVAVGRERMGREGAFTGAGLLYSYGMPLR